MDQSAVIYIRFYAQCDWLDPSEWLRCCQLCCCERNTRASLPRRLTLAIVSSERFGAIRILPGFIESFFTGTLWTRYAYCKCDRVRVVRSSIREIHWWKTLHKKGNVVGLGLLRLASHVVDNLKNGWKLRWLESSRHKPRSWRCHVSKEMYLRWFGDQFEKSDYCLGHFKSRVYVSVRGCLSKTWKC